MNNNCLISSLLENLRLNIARNSTLCSIPLDERGKKTRKKSAAAKYFPLRCFSWPAVPLDRIRTIVPFWSL